MEGFECEVLDVRQDNRNDKYRGHNKRRNFREVKERSEKTAARYNQKLQCIQGAIEIQKENLEKDKSTAFEIQRLNAKMKKLRRMEEKANSLYYYLETHTEHHPRDVKSMLLAENRIKSSKKDLIGS